MLNEILIVIGRKKHLLTKSIESAPARKYRISYHDDTYDKVAFLYKNNKAMTGKITDPVLIKVIAKGGGISFCGQVVGIILRTIYHVVLASSLGVLFYGIYSIGFSILYILAIFAIMGLNLAVVRFIAIYAGEKKYAELKGTIYFSLFFVVGSSLILLTLVWVLAPTISFSFFNKPQLLQVLRYFAVILPFFVLTLMYSFIFRGLQKLHLSVLIREISQPVVAIGLVLILFTLGMGIHGALLAFLGSVMVSSILGFRLLSRYTNMELAGYKAECPGKQLLRFSFPLVFLFFVIILLNRIDVIMLGYLCDAPQVGIYAAAFRIAQLLFMFYAALNSIFGPIFANLFNQKKDEDLKKLFQMVTRWTFTFTLPFCMIVFFFSKELLHIFGEEYIYGSDALRILVVLWLLVSVFGSIGNVLVMAAQQMKELFFSVITLGVNVILNIILIQKYGIVGAALATGIALVLLNIIKSTYIFFKFSLQPLNKYYLKTIAIGCVCIIPIYVTKNDGFLVSLPVMAVCSLAILICYFCGLYWLGLPVEDKAMVQMVLNKIKLGRR